MTDREQRRAHVGGPSQVSTGGDEAYPCPCCGHLVFGEPPGSYEICPICFWEDDAVQLRWPDLDGGANSVSLRTAQRNFEALGACDASSRAHVRPPRVDEVVDAGWRVLTDADPVERPPGLFRSSAVWPSDLTTLYWWRGR